MKPSPSFLINLYQFTSLVESHSNAGHRARYGKSFQDEKVCASKPGQKFVRIFFDNGTQKMSRYFVRIEDGAIFACGGWKVPNLNRQFGTLTTMYEFDWSGYEGVAKPGSSFRMKVTSGPYSTAIPI